MNASNVETNNRAKRRPDAIENTAVLIILIDALVIFGALVLSFVIRFSYLDHVGVQESMSLGQYALFMCMGVVGALLIFGHARLYENEFLLSPRKSLPRISRSCVLWFVCYLAALRLVEPELSAVEAITSSPVSRIYLLIAPCVLLIAMTVWRYVLCKLIWIFARESRLIENVLFLGWNKDCVEAGGIMTNDPGVR